MDVVLGGLVGLERGFVDARAVDVIVRGHEEAEHAPEVETDRRADDPAEVVLVGDALVGGAAPADVAAATAQVEPDGGVTGNTKKVARAEPNSRFALSLTCSPVARSSLRSLGT